MTLRPCCCYRHNEWTKHTNFELGTRVALIISCPWIAGTQGTHSTVFAELVDLFPT